MKKRILICVAHPDDEVLGCGGVIQHHKLKGDQVYCLSLTNGVSARDYNSKIIQKKVLERKKCAITSAKVLGFKWLDLTQKFEDNRLDKYQLLDVVKFIEKAKKKVNPHIIYTHNQSDLSIDHKVIYNAVITAFRPQDKEIWQEILTFEIPSSTDFNPDDNFKPNYIIDIKKFIKKKIKAFSLYKEEVRKYPHSRSLKGIETLAKIRGLQNGIEYGEAFQIVKKIKR